MATATKSQGQLLDWTLLDEGVGIESNVLNSGEGYDDSLQAMLHVTMAHIDANANTGSPGFVVLIRVNGTDEGWREFVRLSATITQANGQVLFATSGAGEGSPEKVLIAATANFDGIGDVAFLKDAGTLADSCLIFIKDVDTNVSTSNIDDLVNTYDTSDYLYDVVDQWNIELPISCDEAKVLFFNDDADSEFACRVDYSFVDAIS